MFFPSGTNLKIGVNITCNWYALYKCISIYLYLEKIIIAVGSNCSFKSSFFFRTLKMQVVNTGNGEV